MAIIEVNHVTKEYQLGQLASLKETATRVFKRLSRKGFSPKERFKALDDVDFKIDEGEVVGIIGSNGAGKSTLLKHLASITKPTRGTVIIRGSVAPLIEVGAGVNPELTGRENIYLNGAILGIPKKTIRQKLDEIVAFAELEQFIDTPVKRYSSGMTVRLGFAIATSIDADILIVDEVLAVGDLAFQRKCFDRMEDLIKRQKKTVLLVSHNIRQVERLCSRVLLLDHGRVLEDGTPSRVCNTFYDNSNAKIKSDHRAIHHITSDAIDAVRVQVLNEAGEAVTRVEFQRPMSIRISFKVEKPLKQVSSLIGIHTTDLIYLTNNDSLQELRDYEAGWHSIELKVYSMNLIAGVYCIRFWIGNPDAGLPAFYGENLATFQVFSNDYKYSSEQGRGLFHIDASWRFSRVNAG
jgi:lipopolysaccharide transport system ATP-binding protein